jgi:Icc-related predicted phosphoesterase
MILKENKKSSRRKTLSHLEIDDFLRDSENVIKSPGNDDTNGVFKKSKVSDSKDTLDRPIEDVDVGSVAVGSWGVTESEDEAALVREFKTQVRTYVDDFPVILYIAHINVFFCLD